MPVLFMRLRSGRIGYGPASAMKAGAAQVAGAAAQHQARPLHADPGPGPSEWLLGSHRDIAERWAADFGYPMSPGGRESLPQVAQYLAYDQDITFMRDELDKQLRSEVQRRYGASLNSDLLTVPLDKLISAVATLERRRPMNDLQNPGSSTVAHLHHDQFWQLVGRFAASCWQRTGGRGVSLDMKLETLPSIFDSPSQTIVPRPAALGLPPSAGFTRPTRWCITEDDYFDYLIGVTGNNDLIPPRCAGL